MWTHGCIGDVLSLIQNGVNCKQDKSGVGDKVSRIETIADSNINYDKTGFAVLDEKQKAKAILQDGDILFSHINSPIHVGKTAIYDGVEPLYHGINLLRLQTIDAVDSRYFNMFLISLFQSGYWKRTSKQSVNQASVNQTDIKQVPFSYPPLAEQQRIVAKLDAAFSEIDKEIENAKSKLRESNKLKDAYLDEKLNILLYAKPHVCLSDVCERVSVGHVGTTSKYYCDDGIPFIRTQNVSKTGFDDSELRYITREFHDSLKKSQLRAGDVLLSRVVIDEMRTAIVPHDYGEANCANVILIRPTESLLPHYLSLLIKSRKSQEYFMGVKKGAAQQVVNTGILKNWILPLPTVDEQSVFIRDITTSFEHIDSLISNVSEKIQLLMSLKERILTQELNPSEAA